MRHRSMLYGIPGLLVMALGDPGVAPAASVTSSFEFFDVDGLFQVGTSPETATFENGRAQSVGSPGLYKSGLNAWMISPGQTGTVTFESPAATVTLWFRDETTAVTSVLTAYDGNGNVLASFQGTTTFQKVSLVASEADRIASLTLTNNGGSGSAVIDDFTSCSGIEAGPVDDPIPAPIPATGAFIRLEPVATGLTAPNWAAPAPGQPGRLFVADQAGTVWAIDLASETKSVFLDVSTRLVPLGVAGPGSFDERGLLGLAFHPDFATNGLLYTYTSEPALAVPAFSTMPDGASADHQSIVLEWRVPDPGDAASVVDPGSVRVLLRIDQPQFNHDGGGLAFGPDGMLYVSLGDGGAADDQGVGHSADGNGSDMGNVLGSILRIDPLGNNAENGRYGVPSDNPFVGTDGAAEEVWAYGFRNPFRFSFDPATGDLYVADVGQNAIEEIDIGMPGGNFGWRTMEGTFFFDPNGDEPGFVTTLDPGGTDDLLRPIAEYDHDEGTAIIGGFVYRGESVPALAGRYVFGDFARTFQNDGRLFQLDETGEVVELRIAGGAGLGLSLLGFGYDAAGEIYVLGNSTGTPFGDTGVVLRIAATPPACGSTPRTEAECRAAGKSSLQITDRTPGEFDAKDRLKWQWTKGAATAVGDFDDPILGSAAYRLCLYDATGLVEEFDIPPGGSCDGNPCWSRFGGAQSPTGFSYKRKTGSADGVRAAVLKSGDQGGARVKVVGGGVRLATPRLPLSEPVTVELVVDDGEAAECWQSVFQTPARNESERFRATAVR